MSVRRHRRIRGFPAPGAIDWKVAEGRFKDAFEYRFPVTIGRDYAGVVAAVGSAVTRVAPGEEVFGYVTGQVTD
jgi:NADPH:quinone reductase